MVVVAALVAEEGKGAGKEARATPTLRRGRREAAAAVLNTTAPPGGCRGRTTRGANERAGNVRPRALNLNSDVENRPAAQEKKHCGTTRTVARTSQALTALGGASSDTAVFLPT